MTMLDEASNRLHGYRLHGRFRNFLAAIADNSNRLIENGVIDVEHLPSRETDYQTFVDFDSLKNWSIVDAIGFCYYIYASHKWSSQTLMESPGTRVLYLRGFDYEEAAGLGSGVAIGSTTSDSRTFSQSLAESLATDFDLFKALSPNDLQWETVTPSNYFERDLDKVNELAKRPIRSFYFNANYWRDDMAGLIDKMDYFIVYISSITESVLWETELLEQKQRAQHTTVVFDEEAIEKKHGHVELGRLVNRFPSADVVWEKKRREMEAMTADQVRNQLERKFLVVTPDEFFADVPAQKSHIKDSAVTVSSTDRTTPLEFRFYPAVDGEFLDRIREFDAGNEEMVRHQIASSSVANLPWFMGRLQLGIYSALLLGNFEAVARNLARYGAAIAIVEQHLERLVVPGQLEQKLELLNQHFLMAKNLSHQIVAHGDANQFVEDRPRAERELHPEFDGAVAAFEHFAQKALDALAERSKR